MPPKKHGVVWEAAPHTIAKVRILEGYLVAWFQILGRTRRGQDILYVDGFAGPGEYTNHPKGSPLAALSAAGEAIARTGAEWVAGNVHCAFIEADRRRREHLQAYIDGLQLPARVRIHVLGSSFEDGIAALRPRVPAAFDGAHPLFVFIDPFGATGAPFHLVKDILRSPCSEVLINLDADGIGRIFRAGSAADSDRILTSVFGDRSWAERLSHDLAPDALYREVLTLYKARLRSLPACRYVFAFEMRSSAKELNYFLVFASQHPLGLEKMKEAMRKVDQTGDYCFADANVDQPSLLRFDDPSSYARRLWSAFRGRVATYEELRDYALNETPFVNPKAMLKQLENDGLITVQTRNPKRRRGSFDERSLVAVQFLAGEADG